MPATQHVSTVEAREIITIGSDPELAIVSDKGRDSVIDACSVFRPKKSPTAIDCDFGYDGHSATAEIRPRPKATPDEAVREIKQLLERNKKIYPQAFKFNLMATSQRLSLGGHIHFGHEALVEDGEKCEQLAVNLDNLLAFPSLYLENKADAKVRRTNYDYGHLSDWRPQNWGMEYRVLSSYIASEELTREVFYLAHAIADATLYHDFRCKPVTKTEAFDYAFNQQARDLLRPYLPLVFKQDKKLPKYKTEQKYRENIDAFIENVKKELPMFSEEIKKGWHINFDITEFFKVEKIETLLEKIAKLLVAIHTTRRKFRPITFKFCTGSFKDTSCPQIARDVNLALNHLIKQEVLKDHTWLKIRVYGLKEQRGNEVWIGKTKLENKREKQLLAVMWDIASHFQHTTKINSIKFSTEANRYSIALGRKIREENLLLAEAMTLLVILMINKDLFKQTEKHGNSTKKLYITKAKMIRPIVKNLKKIKKMAIKAPLTITKKLNNVELPFIFDLRKCFIDILHDIQALENNEREEVAEMLSLKAKKLWAVLGTNTEMRCPNHCEQGYCAATSPLIKLCPVCILREINTIVEESLRLFSAIAGWQKVFKSRQACCECGKVVEANHYYCLNCHKCDGCCNCSNCAICGESDEHCHCHVCDGCEERVPQGSYCSGCGRCDGCGCECGDHPGCSDHPSRLDFITELENMSAATTDNTISTSQSTPGSTPVRAASPTERRT